MADPYDVLGVTKTATDKEIKSAFRKLAKTYHPDQNPNDPKAKERFNAANQAYEILGDDAKRKQFDRGEIDAEGKPRFHPGMEGFGGGNDPFAGFRRQAGAGGRGQRFDFRTGPGGGMGGGGPFAESDIFSEIFGQAFNQGAGPAGGRPAQGGGADLAASLDISIEQMAGGEKVTAIFPGGRKIAVKLPDYVEDGQVIRLKGQGEASPLGGPAGDALVTLRIRKHPVFTVEGRDLHMDLPVSLKDAVLGAKLPVETVAGKVAVTVPAWSNSDKVLRLKGRGLPLKDTSQGKGKGDLYVHVRIMLPVDGDPALEALMRAS